MAVLLNVNGVSYSFPNTGDEGWGDNVTNWATAVSQSTLQKNGGAFTLTSEVDFGPGFGLKSLYYKGPNLLPAVAGVIRLSNLDNLSWRNAANSADLPLTVNASNILTFNGVPIPSAPGGILPATQGGTGFGSYAIGDLLYADTVSTLAKLPIGTNDHVLKIVAGLPSYGLIVNANVDPAAAIAYSKLNLAGSVNLASDVTGVLPIANGGTGQSSQTAAFDALSPTTTKGDLIVSNGTDNVRLPVGANTFVLTADSAEATGIKWAAAGAASINYNITTKTANYTLSGTDTVVLADGSGGTFTLTLPTAVGVTGKYYILKRIDSNYSNIVNINTTSGQTIDGYSSVTLITLNESYKVYSDGANWQIEEHKTITPWTTYTLDINGELSNPTKATTVEIDSAKWRRVGSNIEIQYSYYATDNTGAANGSGFYLFTIPPNLTIDLTSLTYYTENSQRTGVCGIAGCGNNNAGSQFSGYLVPFDNQTLKIINIIDGNTVQTVASSFVELGVAGTYYSFNVSLPITNWYE